ncbi:NADH (or F420H2) dehydrogenase, subunit C [Desulfotomaculum nigrificans CO-1-SRB]|uniref:NADH-quinone oxidoreductase n=1 Tax=Desulfotomaculum nigrificans (strain DSM 14880 / VKM B-2319 / CO-1-SRB) TaxID=868595 RepID=F6B3F3_DESCC|nr:NADH-quinone oxidoreductase subunit C [Desulfotomaculum nigrificans]AEF93982.1 NADH (or F420H2) dehydrogenase, subunit C [Desulfotomaculum nigrificans CO-1-SRB]
MPLPETITELKAKYPDIEVSGEIITVPLNQLTQLMTELKEKHGYNFLTNVTAVDYPPDYFEMVYNLSVVGAPDMIQVKTKVDRNRPEVPSMVPIWGGAIWQEREIYDLLGITFTNHPDLRRILLDDNWEGHPLRKDYQWEGGRE